MNSDRDFESNRWKLAGKAILFIIMLSILITFIVLSTKTFGPYENFVRTMKELSYAPYLQMETIDKLCLLNTSLAIDYCNQAKNYQAMVHMGIMNSGSVIIMEQFVGLVIRNQDLLYMSNYRRDLLIEKISLKCLTCSKR